MELSLFLAPFAQRFLLNAWLYLQKQDWATFKGHKEHCSATSPQQGLSATPVSDLLRTVGLQ